MCRGKNSIISPSYWIPKVLKAEEKTVTLVSAAAANVMSRKCDPVFADLIKKLCEKANYLKMLLNSLNPNASPRPRHCPVPHGVCASTIYDPNGSVGMSGLGCQEGFDKTVAVGIGSMSKEVRACTSLTRLFCSLGVCLGGLVLFSQELVSLTAETHGTGIRSATSGKTQDLRRGSQGSCG